MEVKFCSSNEKRGMENMKTMEVKFCSSNEKRGMENMKTIEAKLYAIGPFVNY
jgi:hypothetical protein